jgi:hypothetical protein
VIFLNVPHRHDLGMISCVNGEVVFNRKLSKYVKALNHVCVIEVDSDRHGFYMNFRCKEKMGNKIMKVVTEMIKKKKSNPITMSWKEEEVKEKTEIQVQQMNSDLVENELLKKKMKQKVNLVKEKPMEKK